MVVRGKSYRKAMSRVPAKKKRSRKVGRKRKVGRPKKK